MLVPKLKELLHKARKVERFNLRLALLRLAQYVGVPLRGWPLVVRLAAIVHHLSFRGNPGQMMLSPDSIGKVRLTEAD